MVTDLAGLLSSKDQPSPQSSLTSAPGSTFTHLDAGTPEADWLASGLLGKVPSLELAGLSSNSFWTALAARYSGLFVSVVLNTFTLGAMYRVMARVAIPFRNLLFGSLLGAAILAGLSVLAGLLFRTSSNPLLATFTVFIGLLLWFNLMSRVILLSASWIAVGMFDRGLSPRHLSVEEAEAERATAEREARELVASAELQHAREDLAAARWYSRLPAQHRVAKAEERLNALVDEGAVGRPR